MAEIKAERSGRAFQTTAEADGRVQPAETFLRDGMEKGACAFGGSLTEPHNGRGG